MFVALVGVTVFRPRTPRAVEAPTASSSAPPVAADSVASAASAPAPLASASGSAAASTSAATAAPGMPRPLRVVGLGWDVLAPGLIANQGRDAGRDGDFKSAGIDVAFTPADSMTSVESALARGGADAQGADIAVVPLPAFVAGYERLRALDPRVFYVVGWSRGREAMTAGKTSLQSIPATGNVTVAGEPASTATYLALSILDLVGVPSSRVELVAPDKAGQASFIAWEKAAAASEQPKGAVVVTTADATRLVPIVAIAPSGWTTDKQEPLRAWVRGWVAGQHKVRGDAAGSARELGAMASAPDPLVIVQRLGLLSWATLDDNARMAGLSGRGAVTTEALFQQAWRLWRDTGVLTTPPPDAAVTEPAIVASLVRSGWSPEQPASGNASRHANQGEGPVLLSIALPAGKLDEDVLVGKAGWVAGLFDRSTIRLAVRGPRGVDTAKTKAVVETVIDRFDVAPERVSEASKVVGNGAASIEVLGVR